MLQCSIHFPFSHIFFPDKSMLSISGRKACFSAQLFSIFFLSLHIFLHISRQRYVWDQRMNE